MTDTTLHEMSLCRLQKSSERKPLGFLPATGGQSAIGRGMLLSRYPRLDQEQEPEAPAVKREAEEDWGR
jgi:hypothetical protein